MTIASAVRLVLGAGLFLPLNLTSQSADSTVFEGFPVVKIEMQEGQVASSNLSSAESREYKVRIVKRGERYFWATRDSTELIKIEGVPFTTYLSPKGLGYVKMLSPLMMELYKQLPKAEQEKNYRYIEHVTIQLGAVTYFGR